MISDRGLERIPLPRYVGRTVAGQEESKRRNVRVRTTCPACGRLVVHNGRVGIYTRCQCGAYVPGPAMLAHLTRQPDPQKRRRQQRKQPPAPEGEGQPARTTPAAAPVRRKTKVRASSPPAAAAQAPSATSPAATPQPERRGVFDRILWGPDD